MVNKPISVLINHVESLYNDKQCYYCNSRSVWEEGVWNCIHRYNNKCWWLQRSQYTMAQGVKFLSTLSLTIISKCHSHLFELLDLGLVEHGKDVWGGPLATLLWVFLTSCTGTTLRVEQTCTYVHTSKGLVVARLCWLVRLQKNN